MAVAPVAAIPLLPVPAILMPEILTRSTGVGTTHHKRKYGPNGYRPGPGSNPLQDLRAGAIPHPHGELPPVPAPAASEGGIFDSAAGDAGAPRRRPAIVREVAEPRDRGEHRAAHPPVAGIPRDDAEPAPGALARVPVVSI